MIGLLAALLVPGLLFACEAHNTVHMHTSGNEDQDEIKVCTSGADCPGDCLTDMCKIPIQQKDNECSRAGVWKNELNSVLQITCSDGEISGFYCSAVGQATYIYPLSGRYLVAADKSTVIMGWTVAWENSYGNSQSSTSWSAISYKGHVIYSQWLLTAYQTETESRQIAISLQKLVR